ncbi:MAG: SGNH/GDSL hydrolase family protein, partial [Ktedonobacterales bacterium]|nr:SGNH/GDSL hydrolase family protein [Ktedonobacterales bacterium]
MRWSPNRAPVLVAIALALGLIVAAPVFLLAGARRGVENAASFAVVPPPRVTPHATPTSTSTPRPTPARPTYATALSIGDSLAGGYFASDWAHAYMAIVTAKLPTRLLTTPVYYGHSAVNALVAMRQSPPPPADVAVLELGTNDQESLTTFATDYADVLTLLRRANPRMRLVCLGPWQPHDQDAYNAVV